MLKEIQINVAQAWLATGAITLTETGEENSYYVNEFGHRFFCKNYPEEASRTVLDEILDSF